MAISEEKMRIVIDNYFKTECDVNTSIRQAFEKGFRIGVKKGLSVQPERKKGKWISREGREDCYECSECHAVIESNEVYWRNNYFCYHCGADMRGEQDE